MPKHSRDIAVETVRQVCQWCSEEILSGRNPPIWGTCPQCQKVEAAFLATPACPNCGARDGMSVGGVRVHGGHRDNCLTRAQPVGPRQRLTEEDVAEIRHRLGSPPKAL
jgi:hypothetical protein